MKRLLIGLLFILAAKAQLPQPQQLHVKQLFYNGSTLQYICEAPVPVASTSVAYPGGITNIVVSGGTATVTTVANHYLYNRVQVVLSGSAVTGLNGTYMITYASATTYTFTTAAANGTYTTGIVITTSFPLLNAPTWSITALDYNGSSLLDGVVPAIPGSQNYVLACTNRANY